MKNGKPVVLVVEDSPMIRMGAVDLVLSAGYETLEAGDAEEAYRVLESRADIDLVFTNVQMPATRDGIKPQHPGSLAPCKADRRLRRSHDRREHAARGSRFFSKPYDELSITEAMAHLLSSEHPHSPIA